jgi:NifU-like protein involved in Fe-S cluster formation
MIKKYKKRINSSTHHQKNLLKISKENTLNKKTNISARVNLKSDVMNQYTGQSWVYSDIVKDHFFNPRNLLLKNPKKEEFDVTGEVGSPACGDVMKMWIKIDKKNDKIRSLKWRTFGCGSAIAATSIFSVIVTERGGMKINKALKVKPQDIIKRLGGLPERKIHCSVLCDKAFHKALNNYFRQSGQIQRIIVEGSKVIDKRLNITDKDIEEAVLEGARTVEDLQKKLKVGVGDKEALPEIEQLLRFYSEKYYGKEK